MKFTAQLRLWQYLEDCFTGRQPWFDPEQPRACYPEMENPEKRSKIGIPFDHRLITQEVSGLGLPRLFSSTKE